jgi:glycosyltransferase involved in cell wall biosynthesis
MPRVSVVIPAYNHERFVGEAVCSVLAQTMSDLELIVVDDGSTDGTRATVESIRDPRLRVIAQPNRGTHAALNAGIQASSAALLAILNSDDAYAPERLARATAILDAEPDVALVGSHIEVIDAVGTPIGIKHGWTDLEPWPLEQPTHSFRAGTDPHAVLLTEHFWSTTSNFVFRRTDADRVGAFRPLRYTHDWDFALRLALIGRSVLLAEPLLRYRVHERNTIREDQAAMIFEICWCLAVHLPQHLATAWFADFNPAVGVERLLQSIHTFGCDRVLAVLLAHGVAADAAVAWLTPGDARRGACLEFIADRLHRHRAPGQDGPAAPPPTPSGWIGRWRARRSGRGA